jgi:hypothetical protein
MPAPVSPISLEFRRGIDTRNSPRLVDPSFMLQAQNRYFDTDVGLKKRAGYTALPKTTQSGTISKGTSLVSYKNELLLFDDTFLWSYSADAGWLQRGVCIPTTVGLRTFQATNTPYTCDYMATPTLEVWVSQDSRNVTDIRITIADRLTGAIVLNDYLLASGKRAPRFVQTATGWLLLYLNGFQLYARPFIGSATTPFGAEQLIDVLTNKAYDVAFDGKTTLVAYFSNSTGSITVAPLAVSGAIATPAQSGYGISTTSVPAAEISLANWYRISMAFDPTRTGYVFVAIQHMTSAAGYTPSVLGKFINAAAGGTWTWSDPDVVTWQWTDSANGGSGQPLMAMAAGVSTNGIGRVFATYRQVGHLGASTTVRFLTSSPGNANRVWYGTAALSRPFRYNGDEYIWMMANGASAAAQGYTTQRTAFAHNATRNYPVARLAYGLTGASLVDQSEPNDSQAVYLPTVLATDSAGATFVMAGLKNTALGYATTNFTLSFVAAWQLRSARLGDSQVLCGGVVQSYDGAGLTEHGFLLAPEVVSIATAGAGNVTGNVQYAIIWEWTDATGQRHRSAPSTVVPLAPASQQVTVKLNSLPALISSKTNVVAAVYRTANNGVFFQRLGTVANDPTAPFLTYTDNATDASIAANEILYTVGGELPNDPPPASQVICATKNRLFVAGGDDYDVVTYTKAYSKNAGPAFSLAFQRRISFAPGPITGIATMDDKVVVFKNPGIFWWNGNGPSVSGVNDDFSPTRQCRHSIPKPW